MVFPAFGCNIHWQSALSRSDFLQSLSRVWCTVCSLQLLKTTQNVQFWMKIKFNMLLNNDSPLAQLTPKRLAQLALLPQSGALLSYLYMLTFIVLSILTCSIPTSNNMSMGRDYVFDQPMGSEESVWETSLSFFCSGTRFPEATTVVSSVITDRVK